MYSLKVETNFASAHNLRNYKGKCENLHGHNWKVTAEFSSATLNDIGIVIDFKELKQLLNNIIDELDHHYLNELPAFKEQNPSSENIAKYIYTNIKNTLNNNNVKIDRVTVWESDNCSAAYWE
ncbi:6-carboxytetrahydropterin synthase QueD [Candidatus Poribacteria bacterium]|nr:6-carboxytetrahydropterin synthase QueD [Candidatus Poribacteria bacterium]